MTTCRIFMETCQICYVDLSDTCNIVVICIALIGQKHVFKINSLTNEYVTSQHKDLTSQHKDLTSQHKYLTSQHNYLTSDGRNMPP